MQDEEEEPCNYSTTLEVLLLISSVSCSVSLRDDYLDIRTKEVEVQFVVDGRMDE